MRDAALAAGLISCLAFASTFGYAAVAGWRQSPLGEVGQPRTVSLDCESFEEQIAITIRATETQFEFLDLDPGDILLLQGRVQYASYFALEDVTLLGLEACGPMGISGIELPGNRAGEFGTADLIEASLSVLEFDNQDEQNRWYGEWLAEALGEGDSPGFWARLDRSDLRVLESGECQVGINLVEGINNDLSQWLLQIYQAPTGKRLDATYLTLWASDGSVSLPATPLEAFRDQGTDGVQLLQFDPAADELQAGDIVLIERARYPAGTSYEISDHCGVLYEGEF